MSLSLRAEFDNSPHFLRVNKVYYDKSFSGTTFSLPYLNLRKKEGRLYDDGTVKILPNVNRDHPLYGEWMIRKNSLEKLTAYISRSPVETVMEVGCGNGWLTHQIALQKKEVCGLDVNETELLQGARIFQSPGISFVCASIFSSGIPEKRFDLILLAASFQYFGQPGTLIKRAMELLRAGGEIHIVDSPFYQIGEVDAARQRSRAYFEKMEMPEMVSSYHHHAFRDLSGFNPELLHDPGSHVSRLKGILRSEQSPFPWIRIKK